MVARVTVAAPGRRIALLEGGGPSGFVRALRTNLEGRGLEVIAVSLADLATSAVSATALIAIGMTPPAATFAEMACVLAVPSDPEVERSLGLPSCLAPFAAVVSETEAQAWGIHALRGGPVHSMTASSAGWTALLNGIAPGTALAECDAARVEVQGTDVTRRLQLVTRSVARGLSRGAIGRDHLVSVVMLSWDQPHFTERCIASVRRYTPTPHEIILVDNGSARETVERVRALADVFIANERNEGFARANNQGLARARGDLVVILNNDTEVNTGWLDGVGELALQDDVGIVAPAVTAAGGWVSVRARPTALVRELLPFSEPPPAVCYVARTAVLRHLQGFSEIYPLGSGEDVDLCFKVWWQGLRVLVDERNVIYHAHGGSTRAKLSERRDELWSSNRQLFLETWLARGRQHTHDVLLQTRAAMSDAPDQPYLTIDAKNWELPRDLLHERRLYARYIAELSLQIQQLEKKRDADLKNIARDREKFAAKLEQLEEARRGPANPDQEQEREITQLRERWGKRLSKLERGVLLARSITAVLALVLAAMISERIWPGLNGAWVWTAVLVAAAACLSAAHLAWQRKRAALKAAVRP